ncbi:hypothetical protein EFA69_04415 [Rufibacter immobilis]|uniref:Uncharacterized protein n=1 Tax=Rufibacter immobilis TaxID=1348778 RepID=A0A3M9N6D7_9BACT|nr:hypothetical protein EFA69_04415 [Rufibacter immobilis]
MQELRGEEKLNWLLFPAEFSFGAFLPVCSKFFRLAPVFQKIAPKRQRRTVVSRQATILFFGIFGRL